MKVTLVLVALVVLGVMVGMREHDTSHEQPNSVPTVVPNTNGTPLKFAVAVDKTGSTFSHGVPQCRVADFEPVLKLLQQQGGEFALAVICSTSISPLVRVYIPVPPIAPTVNPKGETNAFRQAMAHDDYEKKLSAYQPRFALWQAQASETIDSVRPTLDSLLSLPVVARKSDVKGAVSRINAYLSEPDDARTRGVRKLALFVTDGEDTGSDSAALMFSNEAEVLVVPGGTAGILASLHPMKFENVGAAVRYVVRKSQESQASS